MRANVSPRLTRYTTGGDFLSGVPSSAADWTDEPASAPEAGAAAAAGTPDAADAPDAAPVCASCCPTFAQPLTASATHTPARLAIIVLSKRFPNMFDSCFLLASRMLPCRVRCAHSDEALLSVATQRGRLVRRPSVPCRPTQSLSLHRTPDARMPKNSRSSAKRARLPIKIHAEL